MNWIRPWVETLLDQGFSDMIRQMEEWQNFTIPDLEKKPIHQGDALVVEVQVPGWSPRHTIDVRVEENILFVSGVLMERKPSGEQVETHFTMNQLLPVPVDATRVKTEMKQDGRLVVTIPKRKAWLAD